MVHKWAAELALLTRVLPLAGICNTKQSVCRYSGNNCSFPAQEVEASARFAFVRFRCGCCPAEDKNSAFSARFYRLEDSFRLGRIPPAAIEP